MAKPIKETPVLKGKDASKFIAEVKQAKDRTITQTVKDRIKRNFEKIESLSVKR